ncbi:hypothetical protein ABDF71_21660 [Ochrobactrum sp. WV_118_8]
MQFILEVPGAQFVAVYEPIYNVELPCYYSISFDYRLLSEAAADLLKHKIEACLRGAPDRNGYGLISASSQRRPLVIPLPGHWNEVEAALADADMCGLRRDHLLRGTPVKLNCRVYEYRSPEGGGHGLSLESVQVDGQVMRKRFEVLIEEARSLDDGPDCEAA